jgi:hypothetical protein
MKKVLAVVAVMLAVAAAAYGFDGYVSGFITDNTEEDEFAVLADSSLVEVDFDFPAGAQFWVTVYGRNHNELGEFDLSEGATIELKGTGLFFLEVFSKSGSGTWSAEWTDSD